MPSKIEGRSPELIAAQAQAKVRRKLAQEAAYKASRKAMQAGQPKLAKVPQDPLATAKKNVRAVGQLFSSAQAAPIEKRGLRKSTNVENRRPQQATDAYEHVMSEMRIDRRMSDLKKKYETISRDANGMPRKRPRKPTS